MITITKPLSDGDSTIYELSDVMSAEVDESLNNEFELTISYPIVGENFDVIQPKAWVRCKSNPYTDNQDFFIYYISKPIGGIVTIKAEHKFYIAANAVCRGRTDHSSGETAADIIAYLNAEIAANPAAGAASFFTDIPGTVTSEFNYEKPSTCKQVMSDAAAMFGGMWEFNNDIATLKQRRGTDRGFIAAYGVNVTDATTNRDITAKYSHICPFWIGDVIVQDYIDGKLVDRMEKQNVFSGDKYITISQNPGFFNPYMYDCTDRFISKPSDTDLINAAYEFINDVSNRYILNGNDISVSVNVIPLKKTSEYINDDNYSEDDDRIEIGDNVQVITRYNETENMICTGTRYDVLKDRYLSIELGYPPVKSSGKQSSSGSAVKKSSISYTVAVSQHQTQNINYTLAHPAAPVPNRIVKVSPNEVYAVYGGNRRETWKADGEGNERYNFRKYVTAEV